MLQVAGVAWSTVAALRSTASRSRSPSLVAAVGRISTVPPVTSGR